MAEEEAKTWAERRYQANNPAIDKLRRQLVIVNKPVRK